MTPRSVKYGFELELDGNVTEAVGALNVAGLLESESLCPYHCRCQRCSDWSIALRAQTDSTCEGELISGIREYGRDDPLFGVIERALAVADARISTSCGFHVHVSVNGGLPHLGRAIETYCAVEEHLVRMLAPGRWRSKRSMNLTIIEGVRLLDDHATYIGEGVDWDRPRDTIVRAIGHDRHMDLNIDGDRTQTVEYRLWNATMMAWRMELACRLSCWLATHTLKYPSLASVLETAVTNRGVSVILPATLTWDEFVADVEVDDPTCASLMSRQAAYVRDRY